MEWVRTHGNWDYIDERGVRQGRIGKIESRVWFAYYLNRYLGELRFTDAKRAVEKAHEEQGEKNV